MFLPTDNSTLQLSIVDWSVKLLLSPLFLTYILSSIGVNELLRISSLFLSQNWNYRVWKQHKIFRFFDSYLISCNAKGYLV